MILNHHRTDSNSQRLPLVLLHGLFGSLENLAVIRRHFESEREVISVDLPDHGKSRHTQGFSFKHHAELIAEHLQALNVGDYHLLGHSLGGKLAMQIALEGSPKPRSLVIADISPDAYPPRHHQVLAGLNNVELNNIQSRSDADNALKHYIAEAGVRQFLLKSLYQDEYGWQWRFNLTMLERDYPILSRSIESDTSYSKPVLFVKGGDSDYLLSEHKPRIAKLFPKAQAKVIDGAGHWLHAEKPEAFNRIVSRFLQSVESNQSYAN